MFLFLIISYNSFRPHHSLSLQSLLSFLSKTYSANTSIDKPEDLLYNTSAINMTFIFLMDRIHHLIQLEQSFQDRKQNLEDEFLDTKNHLIQEKEARIRELQSSLTEKNTYIEQEVKQRLKDRQITSSPPPFTLDEQEYSKRIIQALNR